MGVVGSTEFERVENDTWKFIFDNGITGMYTVREGRVTIVHDNGYQFTGRVAESDVRGFSCRVAYDDGIRADYLTMRADGSYHGEHTVRGKTFAQIASVISSSALSRLADGKWTFRFENGVTGQYMVQTGRVKVSHVTGYQATSGRILPSDRKGYSCMVKYGYDDDEGHRVDYLVKQRDGSVKGEHVVKGKTFARIALCTRSVLPPQMSDDGVQCGAGQLPWLEEGMRVLHRNSPDQKWKIGTVTLYRPRNKPPQVNGACVNVACSACFHF